ncbi:MAG: hypothetical protein E6H57_16520 [Betaproteobacteria bacterium]|nr:MAG: hypothetical protein E6H57_16520 [Betaproteobacteria bacterium]
MARLVRDETGMHADERKHENRQRTHGDTRSGQQRRVCRRIARQDERAVSSGARGGRAEASRTGELRDQLAVQAFPGPQFHFGFHEVSSLLLPGRFENDCHRAQREIRDQRNENRRFDDAVVRGALKDSASHGL